MNLTKEERETLLDAYIPKDFEIYFGSDTDLFEVFQAHINFASSDLADEYMDYIVRCFQSTNEEDGVVDVLKAKDWLQCRMANMQYIIDCWETTQIDNVDFF